MFNKPFQDRLRGNKAGSQVVYLRADTNLNRYVAVELTNNYLYVTEREGGPRKILFKLNLNEHDGIAPISIPEDKKAAEIKALETFVRYATSAETAKIYAERLKDKELEKVPSVAEGAEEYIPVISRHAKGDRMLTISIKGNKIGATVDGKEAVKDLAITNVKGGTFFLESGLGLSDWSQRNLSDDVYDGVFEKLVITENTATDSEKVIYDGKLQGWDGIKYNAKKYWESLINWFMTTF